MKVFILYTVFPHFCAQGRLLIQTVLGGRLFEGALIRGRRLFKHVDKWRDAYLHSNKIEKEVITNRM